MALPREVVLSIERILHLEGQRTDPSSLDTLGEFDPVPTLNRLFPDEESLGRIDEVQEDLRRQHQALEAEIKELRKQMKANQDPARMQLIQELISELVTQISLIREKASESEAIVRDITKDIQRLDRAKTNISTSITALRRLGMLVNALGQLEEHLKAKKYAELAQTLAAIRQLKTQFKPLLSIPDVTRVYKKAQEAQGAVKAALDVEFENFFVADPTKPVKASSIADACLVIDVLGPDVRAALLDRYALLELRDYRRIFKATDEAGQLDNVSRRYAWFKRCLTVLFEGEGSGLVFPESWHVSRSICARFCEVTFDDLTSALAKAASSLNVTLLLEALQHTLEFEQAMSRRFEIPMAEIMKSSPTLNRAPRTISSAFDAHLGVFIGAQDRAISDMISKFRAESKSARPSLELSSDRTDREESAPVVVLPSSTELFYIYGQVLEQTAKLTTGKPFLELVRIYGKWLKIYAQDLLVAKLKKPDYRERRSPEKDGADLKTACLVLNTADYCQVTASELEDKLTEKISEEFRGEVTLQNERDVFVSVISASIATILSILDSVCDPHLLTLQRTKWELHHDHVTGPSPYVMEFVKAVDGATIVVREGIDQKKYLRNWADKAGPFVMTRFTNALVRSRPLKEVGAEQLLLDLQQLKACLLRFPGPPPPDTTTQTAYAKNISKSIASLETLLKVVIAPTSPPEAFVANYTLFVGDSSFANFQKVLDLKGTPMKEQNTLLDAFVTITSTAQDLDSQSFLSTIDMDPGTSTPALGAPTSSGAFTAATGVYMGGAAGMAGIYVGSPSSTFGSPPTVKRGESYRSGTASGTESPRMGASEGKVKLVGLGRSLMQFASNVRKDRDGSSGT